MVPRPFAWCFVCSAVITAAHDARAEAPTAPAPGTPASNQAVLALTARYGKDLPVINSGLVWRVFADKPDDTGTFKLIREERGATPNIVLPPGNYVVHVALGLVGALASAVGVALGLSFHSASWIVWTILAVVLLSVFGWRHPPTWDDHVPLDRARMWLAFAALVVFVLCFTPAPITPLDLIRPQ